MAVAGSRLIKQTLSSPRYPASTVPGAFTIDSPDLAASPERGWINPTVPTGKAIAIPRSDQCSVSGFDGDVAGGAQIHTRISGMRTLWNGQVWIQSLQGDGEMVAHVGQDYS